MLTHNKTSNMLSEIMKELRDAMKDHFVSVSIENCKQF